MLLGLQPGGGGTGTGDLWPVSAGMVPHFRCGEQKDAHLKDILFLQVSWQ